MSQDYPEVNISTNPLNMPVFPAVIALGANIASQPGPPDATLLRAFDALPGSGVRLIARSSLWRTPCIPRGAGPDYVNAAAILETSLSPQALLEHLRGKAYVRLAPSPLRQSFSVCRVEVVPVASGGRKAA